MEKLLVSIIMPSYNSSKVIEDTIRSVISQSYKSWELIVVDDCSSDLTKEIVLGISREDQRVKLLPLEKNCGAPAKPRNIGVLNASGEYVAFLDSDDIWHPEKLEFQIREMYERGAYFSSTQMKDFYTLDFQFEKVLNFAVEVISFRKQKIKNRIPTSSVVVKKEVLLNFPFNESLFYKAVEDYHCWLKVHERYGISIKLKYPFLRYRKIEGQISESKLSMVKKLYMLQSEYEGNSKISAILYTFTYIFGSIYYRLFKKRL